jgi:hypothetical protein
MYNVYIHIIHHTVRYTAALQQQKVLMQLQCKCIYTNNIRTVIQYILYLYSCIKYEIWCTYIHNTFVYTLPAKLSQKKYLVGYLIEDWSPLLSSAWKFMYAHTGYYVIINEHLFDVCWTMNRPTVPTVHQIVWMTWWLKKK